MKYVKARMENEKEKSKIQEVTRNSDCTNYLFPGLNFYFKNVKSSVNDITTRIDTIIKD